MMLGYFTFILGLLAAVWFAMAKMNAANNGSTPEQNTFSQAQGPLPPPARLPAPQQGQPAQQAVQQPQTVQVIEEQAAPVPEEQPQQQEVQTQMPATRLPPAAASQGNSGEGGIDEARCQTDPAYAQRFC